MILNTSLQPQKLARIIPSRRITIPVLVLLALIFFSLLNLRLGNSPARFIPHTSFTTEKKPEPDYWTWDTTSRFHRFSNDICDAFPTELLSRVQVVLKMGASEPTDRINAQMATATRCISNLLVVSDREQKLKDFQVHDMLATLPSSYRVNNSDFESWEALYGTNGKVTGETGWKLDKYKFVPMVERAYEVNPTANWFVFMESDTYMVWDNLFRLLDNYDHNTPLYFGSPSPGRRKEEEQTWFGYGGAGFVLSAAAVQKFVAREAGSLGELSPSVTEQYVDVVRSDCCGDSVLGWVLFEKGVKLSGMWPMFNPHPLHGIPFDDAYWCQPVITLHKTAYTDMGALTKWEHKRGWKTPLLYADLLDYSGLGTFTEKADWDNGDWGGWMEPPEAPGHASKQACKAACHDHPECLEFTYDSDGHCVFMRTVRLGSSKTKLPGGNHLSSGWDLEKIANWRKNRQCEKPLWVKPSLTRIF